MSKETESIEAERQRKEKAWFDLKKTRNFNLTAFFYQIKI